MYYSDNRRMDMGGHLVLLVMNLLGIILTFQLWRRRRDIAVSTRRPKLILLNVFVNLVFDLVWSLDELLLPMTGGMPCGFREIKDSIYYLLVNEVLLLRSVVLYVTLNRTVFAEKALESKPLEPRTSMYTKKKPASNAHYRTPSLDMFLGKFPISSQNLIPGPSFRESDVKSISETTQRTTVGSLDSSLGNFLPDEADVTILPRNSGNGKALSKIPSPSYDAPQSNNQRKSSPSKPSNNFTQVLHNEFSVPQVAMLEKLQYLGSSDFIVLLIIVTVGLYFIPYIFYWLNNPSQVTISFVDGGGCFSSWIYRSLVALQFFYAGGAFILLLFVKMRVDHFKIKRELIMLSFYWMYFSTAQNTVNIFFYGPVVSIWLWTGNRMLFYFLFSYLPLRMISMQSRSRTISSGHTRPAVTSLSVNPFVHVASVVDIESPELNPTKEVLLEVLRDPKTYEMFKKFLVSEFCVESLLFWREIQDYKKSCRRAELASQVDDLKLSEQYSFKARVDSKKIYDLYLAKGSAFQVNVSSQQLSDFTKYGWGNSVNERISRKQSVATTNLVSTNYTPNEHIKINESLFQEVEDEVLQMMTFGPFPRFLKTAEFMEFKQTEKNKKQTELAMISLVPTSELHGGDY